ncbi:MAG: phage holin [Clostridia bacterium]|nr:phage holin [Clostridia bacterium]
MPKVTKETIARTIALVLALINQILAVAGKDALPFAEDQVYQLISLSLTLVASGLAWWKNNSFTRPALAADLYLKLFQKCEKRERKEAKQCASV